MWRRKEVYLNTPSIGNLTNWSWILSAIYPKKLKITDGGCPGVNVDKKPKMDSYVYSSVKYPRMNESMEITCLEPSRNFEVDYGGLI